MPVKLVSNRILPLPAPYMSRADVSYGVQLRKSRFTVVIFSFCVPSERKVIIRLGLPLLYAASDDTQTRVASSPSQ